jgi:SAM-dependent methyltransferase
MALALEDYLAREDAMALFRRLRAGDLAALEDNLRHFTEREARDRDAIVLGYLGDGGVDRVVEAVVEGLLPAFAMNPSPALLDAGAGSGFFTRRVDQALRAKGLRPRMYALDATPAMLRALAAKPDLRAVPFLGLLEDLEGSVREARAHQPLPEAFDGLFTTLALHHCPSLEQFFEGAARILRFGAPLVAVDLEQHTHEHFRDMGDLHLGFAPKSLEAWALDRFGEAEATTIPDACCAGNGARIGLVRLAARR